ncbi:MAG: hypothetical protein CMD85_05470 [Gammaproteobacteria bacterium]|mgnify:FL=1|nr:hypothetical protein [Gammaproteobacteria bacterium]|tara:strand:+ start:3363 stop:4610 length:1248 start_codon:yes stop_codon:yes gene_type:complete
MLSLIANRTLSSASPWHLFCLSALYLAQGLPNGFLFFAMNTYFASQGASVVELATFSSILLLPWTIKFLLGPLVDIYSLRRFGRRRFWILFSQIGVMMVLLPMAFLGSNLSIYSIGVLVMIINFFIAFQDLATDALAADSLEEKTLTKANGLMWGSKVAGNGLGMFLGTVFYFSYGISQGISLLILLMFLIFLVPLFSKELDFKIGFQDSVIRRNFLGIGNLFKEFISVFIDKRAFWAILFLFFINLGQGVYEVIYNKFFLEQLGWTGQQIGNLRPWGMILGGFAGLLVGIVGTFYQRHLLLFLFIFCQIIIYFLLGQYSSGISNEYAYAVVLGLDMSGAAISVCMFATFMALCTSQSSATNFGIFMGLANISTLIGNNLAPIFMANFSYSGSFLFCSLSLVPTALIAFKLAKKV